MIPIILVAVAVVWAIGLLLAMSLLVVAKRADEQADELRRLDASRSTDPIRQLEDEFVFRTEEAQA